MTAPQTTNRRGRDVADLLPLDAVTPDGLCITSAGTFARTLTVDRVMQPLSMGPAGRQAHRRRMATFAARIEPHQSVQFTVTSDPVDVEEVIATGRADVERAADDVRTRAAAVGEPAERRELEDLAVAMERMHAGEAQTLRRYAGHGAAQDIRYYVTTSWNPEPPVFYKRSGAQPPRRHQARELEWRDYVKAEYDSRRMLAGAMGDLAQMGTKVLDGPSCLALLRSRLAPKAALDWGALESACRGAQAIDKATAIAQRSALLDAVLADAEWTVRGPDIHHADGTIERTVRLDSSPDVTSAWWLIPLLGIELPYRLAVHVHGTDKVREKHKQRARMRRLRATSRSRARRGQDVSPEHEEAEGEAIDVDAELRSGQRATLYDVSVYLTIQEPTGDLDLLDEVTTAVVREFASWSDAQLRPCTGLARPAFASTLPIGIDRLGATRRYASRNIPDLIPLVGTRCGTPGGVPFAFASPGRTLENIDPYDAKLRTPIGTITGLAGSGKTLSMARLCKLWLSRGAQVRIIDRSSTDDANALEGGRAQGHYEPLASLVPGARVIRMASGAGDGGAVICPWDTHDTTKVAAKVKYLTTLHALLIGERAAGTQDRVLQGHEESLLERAIGETYRYAEEKNERPCEDLLVSVLRAAAKDTNGTMASRSYELLAERLTPYCSGGMYSYLLNDETNVSANSPMIVYDLGGLAKQVAGPVSLIIAEREEREISAARSLRLNAEQRRGGSWTGRTVMVLDEAWAQLEHEIAGAWLNEWARRVRHFGVALTVLSQHLADFHTEQGHALLRQASWHLLFQADDAELPLVATDVGLSAEETEIVAELDTEPGHYSTAYMVSKRGRGKVEIQMAELDYWMLSAHPRRDQPLRSAALRDAAGDPWRALRLLCSPEWQAEHAHLIAGE